MTSTSGGPKAARSAVPYFQRPTIGFKLPRLRFEVRLTCLLLLLAAPAVLLACAAMYGRHMSWLLRAGVLVALIAFLAIMVRTVSRHVVRPLQTLSNVVAALRENEYSFRARDVGEGDSLGDLAAQINELAGDLRTRRHRESETFALLERVVETMDLPVFAFDAASNLQLTNPAALKMVQLPAESVLQTSAHALGLAEMLTCDENSVIALNLHGREGRWMVRRSKFYQNGMPHTLLLLSDVSDVLREQERRAWQRLIRVLAHEVNNSLTPIKSIAGSLRYSLENVVSGSEPVWHAPLKRSINPVDMEHGLTIIEERAESLNRFLQTYSQLAKLPPPMKSSFAVRPLLERVCHLETRLKTQLAVDGETELYADASQLEQALINLVRNAADAAMQPDSPRVEEGEPAQVFVSCRREPDSIRIAIQDNGPGLANPANLFIPFYTTKPGGTGIGLLLASQIVEAHGGTLTLTNRSGEPGCCAEIRLPIPSSATFPTST